MRFGRHLKEVIVPGKEADCVRYDELKAAIKTQIAARWEHGESASESEASTSGRLEEGLLASSEEARERNRRAFYDALGFELRRVSRQYDASLAQLKRKVASLLGEARRGSVLDLLQLGADEEALDGPASSPDATSPAGSNIPPSPPAGQHQQQLDRAFRHVYHEVTLVRHNTNLNYTGLRKIVKKFLKKTCKAIAASDTENGDDALRDELTALLDVIPITNRSLTALAALATDEDAGPHGVGSGDEPDSVEGSNAARPPVGPSTPGAPSSVAAHQRRARSHIPLPASPSRGLYQASAAAAESEIRARLRALPFTRGAELASLAEELERAYTQALCLTREDHGEDVARVARRRLRLIERPAPPAADRLSAYSAGVSTCAATAIAVLWSRPAMHPDRCPRCLEYFAACVPAFRLTAMPIAWLWCWAGVTRACGAHYINYRFIMEVSLSEEAGWHWNAAMAAVLTAAWLVIFALFSACVRFGADPLSWNVVPAYYPLGLIVFCVMAFVFPPASIFAVTSEGGAPRRRRAGDDDEGDFARLRAQLARVGRALTRVFNPYARASLVRSIAHMAMAPFGPPVRFRDNLVADVACSLVRCLVDFETTARFFLTGEYEKDRPSLGADYGPTSPVITAVPYWFRLQQCVRRFYDAKRGSRERVEHMINAGKYFVSLLSISLASLGGYSSVTNLDPRTDPGQVAWIAALIVGTLYSYAWDIIMDWGLIAVDFDGGKRTLPRVQWATTRDRVFRSRKFYAWAMVSNLVGRCAWAVTITPHGKGGVFFLLSGGLTGEALGTVVAVIELLRRAQWTFLRLENEYLNNAARYRSVVAAPMLLDEVGSSNWDSEWKFEREEASANTKTITVYLVVAANALAALAVMGVFYLVYSR